jgi:hypothetical protein
MEAGCEVNISCDVNNGILVVVDGSAVAVGGRGLGMLASRVAVGDGAISHMGGAAAGTRGSMALACGDGRRVAVGGDAVRGRLVSRICIARAGGQGRPVGAIRRSAVDEGMLAILAVGDGDARAVCGRRSILFE